MRLNIDPNKIITEGKFDPDLFEEPEMIFVDLENGVLAEAAEDLLFGKDDGDLVDLVMMSSTMEEDDEELKPAPHER